ncbi:MAG: M13 family metallopeptidase [Terriglobales bacterium]
MRALRLVLPLLLLLSLAAAQTPSKPESNNKDSDPTWPLPKLDRFNLDTIDKQINPCDNFYQFVCSKWTAANPIPADEVFWGTSSNLELYNETILRNAMQEASLAKNRDEVHQKIGDYWSACMNLADINKMGDKPIQPMLDRIAAIKSMSDLPDVMAQLHTSVPGAWEGGDNQTPAPMFGFGSQVDFKDASLMVGSFDQAGMSLPSRDYYLQDNPKMAAIRDKFLAHVQQMLELIGEKPEQAKADAATVLRMETAMAKSAMDNVRRRDPANLDNPMSLPQFEKLAPSFGWQQYLKDVNAPTPKHYIVTSPDFFRGLEQLLKTESLDNWKTYLRWWAVHQNARYLSDPFVNASFDFYGKTLFGQQELEPRWRRCVAYADRDLGYGPLGEAYVQKAFPPTSKQRTKALVSAVETGLGEDIHTLDWMGPETKQKAEEKLHAIYDKIGYPDKWRDYSRVHVVPDNLVADVQQATAFESHRQLNKIGKPVDREEWGMTPPTINAYYDPQMNTINFPAGILQPPFFDSEQPEEVNYGAIGLVIGHEISHGFDDQGRKFDAHGNLRDWWTPEDAKRYDEKVACIEKEYTHDVPSLGIKTNGKLTLGEDSADNAGLRISMIALEDTYKKAGKSLDEKDPDGWTPRQKFFLSHAFSWCANLRPEIERVMITTNPHSLNEFRVNYVEKNSPEFWKAFGCKKGQPMVSENACRVW